MRAAIFRKGSFVLGNVPDPQLQPGQVLVRTKACGICGTDLHAARFTREFVSLAAAQRRALEYGYRTRCGLRP